RLESDFQIFIGLKSLDFSRQCFVPHGRRNNFRRDETIFRLARRCPETAVGYDLSSETAGTPAPKPETATCGPSASSSPLPSPWQGTRWLARPTRAFRGSVPSRTAARSDKERATPHEAFR